ncbi:putative two-component response regulator transcriptional regulatory protein [Caenispirillum salinarum AK4]|uniref:Putative two-component response regulator transcriptional regulatory protein n=1 Tax=Caenispirillum salinarum AK4 TaxID=1238182 RepID=K9HFW9_9PROT|nr:response regulator [Caenispirillum salinarum]EKV27531.1 putative two-component response regulator transcriptional regulatory protein [Caenispirillum salinarum AK4]
MHRIAVVDDSLVSALLLKHLLTRLPDVAVEAYQDPIDLLAVCAKGGVDLVVADYRMPALDGATLIDALRLLPGCEAVPVVIVSGQAGIRERALYAGAAAVLGKPVEPLFVQEVVAGLLGIEATARPALHENRPTVVDVLAEAVPPLA